MGKIGVSGSGSDTPEPRPVLTKLRFLGFWAACAFFAAGCASTEPLSKADRARVRKVAIDPVVAVPKEVRYMGTTEAMGYGFGLMGAIVGQMAREDGTASLERMMEDRGINVDAIVHDAFCERLRKSKSFTLAQNPGADGQIKLKVAKYGLFVAPWGFQRLKPIITLNGTLTDSAGRVIWEDQGKVNDNDAVVRGASLAEYMADPEMYRRDLRAVSVLAADRLAAKLEGLH